MKDFQQEQDQVIARIRDSLPRLKRIMEHGPSTIMLKCSPLNPVGNIRRAQITLHVEDGEYTLSEIYFIVRRVSPTISSTTFKFFPYYGDVTRMVRNMQHKMNHPMDEMYIQVLDDQGEIEFEDTIPLH